MEWPLQEAKSKFSALVNAALTGESQLVTRRGRPAVVVLATEEYDRLRRLEEADAPALGGLLLEIPRTTRNSSGCPFPPVQWTYDVSLHTGVPVVSPVE